MKYIDPIFAILKSVEPCFYATSIKNKNVSRRDTNELEDLARQIIAVHEIPLYLDYIPKYKLIK